MNLGADNTTLKITSGKDNIESVSPILVYLSFNRRVILSRRNQKRRDGKGETNILLTPPRRYNAIKRSGSTSTPCSSERSFCRTCSTMLWLWDKQWPELIHPFASAIDSELPSPDEMACIMEDSKPAWVRWPEGKKKVFKEYPDMSIKEWHEKHYPKYLDEKK